MERIVISPWHYVFGKDSTEHCFGKSETVPNEATSLKDLVHRAFAMARLPEIAKSVEDGPDEDFDDIFDQDDPMIDYIENKSFIEKVTQKIAEEKAKKAQNKPSEPTSKSDPIEEPSTKESA